jgi:hypothetical protein
VPEPALLTLFPSPTCAFLPGNCACVACASQDLCGIDKIGHRKRLLKAVTVLREADNAPPRPPPLRSATTVGVRLGTERAPMATPRSTSVRVVETSTSAGPADRALTSPVAPPRHKKPAKPEGSGAASAANVPQQASDMRAPSDSGGDDAGGDGDASAPPLPPRPKPGQSVHGSSGAPPSAAANVAQPLPSLPRGSYSTAANGTQPLPPPPRGSSGTAANGTQPRGSYSTAHNAAVRPASRPPRDPTAGASAAPRSPSGPNTLSSPPQQRTSTWNPANAKPAGWSPVAHERLGRKGPPRPPMPIHRPARNAYATGPPNLFAGSKSLVTNIAEDDDDDDDEQMVAMPAPKRVSVLGMAGGTDGADCAKRKTTLTLSRTHTHTHTHTCARTHTHAHNHTHSST